MPQDDATPPSSASTGIPRAVYALVVVLFFLSGASALAYEVLWARMLSLVFGGTVFAISAVLTSFMLGLGLGSYWFGKIADRTRNCLKLYAGLEFSIAIYAGLTPLIFSAIDHLHVTIVASTQPSRPMLVALRFILAFAALLLPTIAMGATLPLISKFLIRELKEVGSRIAVLYSVNTAGAVVGCFVTGFFLIAMLGVSSSLYLIAAINTLIASAAFLLALRADKFSAVNQATESAMDSAAPDNEQALAAPQAADTDLAGSPTLSRALLWFAAISGFLALAYQVLWTRDYALLYSSTVYGFTVVVVVFLTGIAFGGAAVSFLADRIRRPLTLFALAQIGIGVYSIFLIDVSLRIGIASWIAERLGYDLRDTSWLTTTFNRFGVSSVTMLLPTFLMGCSFPLLIKLYTRSCQILGRGIGQIYGSNTLGCVLGSFAAGYLLIPLLGARTSLYIIGGLSIATGLAAAFADPKAGRTRKALVISVSLSVSGVAFAYALTRPPMPTRPGITRIYSQEGIDGLVEVLEAKRNGKRSLRVNNTRTLGSNSITGLNLQYRQGHLPMLLHPNPQDVLVIGFATGSTSGAMTLHQEVQSIDCVDIIADLKNTATFFTEANHNILEDPRFTFFAEDGRTHARTTAKKYDVIVADLFQAADAGVGSLFTTNHYRACHDRLKEGGIMCQWLSADQLSRENLDISIATFMQVFPDATLWFADVPNLKGIVGIIGTKQDPLTIDVQRLTERINEPSIKGHLAKVFYDVPQNILASYVMGNSVLQELVKGSPINTDDRPLIEFSAPKDVEMLGRHGMTHVPFMLDNREMATDRLTNIAPTPELTDAWKLKYTNFYVAREKTARAQILAGQGKFNAAVSIFQQLRKIFPAYREAQLSAMMLPRPDNRIAPKAKP